MAEDTDLGELPQATVVPKKRTRISVVWIIPILAAVVAIGIAVQRVLSEGPTITIVFRAAEGMEAGKTPVKYKDVKIGQVTAVRLTEDFAKVELTVKMAKSAEGLMVEDARFWVVSPHIGLTGISGLSTLLSGNYIGFGAGKSNKVRRSFTGLEVPPTLTEGELGRHFVLNAKNVGSLQRGSPIYYRRLRVGQVTDYDLAADGKAVTIKVFVDAPYDKYVNSETRFWNASGLDVSLGTEGVDVHMESLVALIEGGLAFDTPTFVPQAEPPAAANTVFTLYRNRAIAMKQPPAIARRYVLYFKESLRGLSVGAPVTLLGLPAGEVTDVGLTYDPATLDISGRVEITVLPEHLVSLLPSTQEATGESVVQTPEKTLALRRHQIEEQGLRAQLRIGSLLTGQLYVALDYFPEAPKVKIDWDQEVPELPVVPSTLINIEAKITSIVDKLDKLPLEAIGNDIKKDLEHLGETLQSATKLINDVDVEWVPEVNSTLEELRRVLKDTDATLVGEDAPGQQELREALQEVARAARSIRVLADYLERHPEALVRGKTKEKK